MGTQSSQATQQRVGIPSAVATRARQPKPASWTVEQCAAADCLADLIEDAVVRMQGRRSRMGPRERSGIICIYLSHESFDMLRRCFPLVAPANQNGAKILVAGSRVSCLFLLRDGEDLLKVSYQAESDVVVVTPSHLSTAEAEVYRQLRLDGMNPADAEVAARALCP